MIVVYCASYHDSRCCYAFISRNAGDTSISVWLSQLHHILVKLNA